MRHREVRHLPVLAAGCLLGVVTGCGQGGPAVGESASSPYSGPLVVPAEQATHPRAGAAGEVVRCTTWGRGGSQSGEVYAEGATADSPAGALEVARGEGLVEGAYDGLVVAAQQEDRVLYVLEVDGVVKEAVIVRDGPATEGAGGPGWYVESWARCDLAELPRSYTDALGLMVWEDAVTGEPVPTTEVEARRGPEHCDWQSMTFLHLGGADYVRHPDPDLTDFFAVPWQPHTALPADATDTGYVRGGQHLWLSADRGAAFVGSEKDVERWPRTIKPLGCD